MKMNFMKEMFFPRCLKNEDEIDGVGRLEKAVFWIGPYVVLAYLTSLGIVSSLDNTFGVLLLLFGIGLWWRSRAELVMPDSIRHMYFVGLLLFAMVILHALIGQKPEMLFKFQFENIRNMLILPFMAMVVAAVRLNAQGVWRLIVLSGSYTIVYLLLVLIQQPPRGHGLLSEAIVLGNLAMMFGLLSLVASFGLQGRAWKFLALAVFVSGLFLSVFSGTRAGWIAFLVAMILLLWAFWTVDRKHFFIAAGGALTAFVLILFFWNQLPIESRFLQAVNDIELYAHGQSNTSVGARLDMWKIGFHAFGERPVFGWGITPFKETFVEYINQGVGSYQLSETSKGFAQPHNDYVFILYHFGIVGFGLVMAFLLYPGLILIKAVRQAKIKGDSETIYLALTGLIALEVLLDFMMFNLAFMNEIFYVFVVVLFLVLFALNDSEKRWKEAS